MSALQAGDEVERYVVHRLLGRGGAAEVYAVEHRLLGTWHALKVLHRTDARHRSQLLEEGRAQAVLDPTYVLPVTDVVALGDGLALLMPYVAGCSLETLLERRRLSEAEVARLVRPVALGVASAHERGLVHRDLKPSNILVDQQRQRVLRDASPLDTLRVRVADFGIARRSGRAWVPGEKVQGSPAYMSPEVLAGSPADERADLWALGVMLYEMLVGHRPFRGLGLNALIDAVRHAPIGLDAVPGRWQPVVDGLLTRDPAERIGSIHELLERLPGLPGGATSVAEAERDLLREVADLLATGRRQVTTAFFGRESELEALHRLVDGGHRMLEVLGPGGVGKTTLIERFAAETAPRWVGGVVRCSLEEAADANGVCRVVLGAMGVPLADETEGQVAAVLAGRSRTLLILDGVEGIVDDVARLIARWAAACPDAVFLLGSRVRLPLAAAQRLRLDGLSGADARSMLQARVLASRKGGELSIEETVELDGIAELLDGMPLALELTAARARQESLVALRQSLASGIEGHLQLGTASEGRHATLQACLEWSFALLSPVEVSVLEQLSVFVGGCTIEAAEAVVEVAPGASVSRIVRALVDQSLLNRDGARVHMLETTRQLAFSRLAGSAGRDALVMRHARWFARYCRPEWLHDPEACDDALDARAERENVRAALTVALQLDDDTVLAGLAGTYARITLSFGPMGEGARVCKAVYERLVENEDRGASDPSAIRRRCVVGAFLLHLQRLWGGKPPVAMIRRLVDDARVLADDPVVPLLQSEAGRSIVRADPQTAERWLREALAVLQRERLRAGEASVAVALGSQLVSKGEETEGWALIDGAARIARAEGFGGLHARALYRQAYHQLRKGNAAAARSIALENLAVSRSVGNAYREAAALIQLADISKLVDVDTAAAWSRRALDHILRLASNHLTTIVYGQLAVLEDMRGNVDAAQAFYDATVNGSISMHHSLLPRANRGRFQLRLGRVEQAVADLTVAVHEQPEGDVKREDEVSLARALAYDGQLDRAEQLLASVRSHAGGAMAPPLREEVLLTSARIALERGDVAALDAQLTALGSGEHLYPLLRPEHAELMGELALHRRDWYARASQAVAAVLDHSALFPVQRRRLRALQASLSAPRT